jgi:hypothetical protein
MLSFYKITVSVRVDVAAVSANGTVVRANVVSVRADVAAVRANGTVVRVDA